MAERAMLSKHVWGLVRPLAATMVGLALGLAVTAIAGEHPLDVLWILIRGAFGTPYDFGMTLFYATPLILTGLAVALPFHAGLFNIGAEGQLTMGALGALLVGALWPALPAAMAIPLAILGAFAFGAAWGFVPGWLKAYRGSHEVITTIMLNFIAAGLASYVVLGQLRSLDTQNPESRLVGESYRLAHYTFFDGAPVSAALPLALSMCVLVWFLLKRTVRGFELSATGAGPDAAATGGVHIKRTQIVAMLLAGGLAGLVGVAEILGNAGRFRLGFSPDYGFIGIPVALLARSHPLALVLSALLFGALHKGAGELDLETMYVTRDLSYIFQAMVVLAVSAEGGLTLWRRRRAVAPAAASIKET